MFGFKKKNDFISVSFIDFESKETFATSKMKPEQLPESFEARTSFKINNDHWEVLEAEPMTAIEFMRNKQLNLTVRKVAIIEGVDPTTLLFSLPTISNGLPPIQKGSTKLNKDIFEIREDDWRQIDIIPLSLIDLINKNFFGIKEIYDQNSFQVESGTAFKTLHISEGLDNPFENNPIKKISLSSDLPELATYEGVSFDGVAGIIENSFAFKMKNGLILYGLINDEMIDSLSVFANNLEEETTELKNVLLKHNLCIADWCNMQIYK